MKKLTIYLIIIFLSIVIYSAQGGFYPTGSIISQASLFTMLGISGIFFIKSLLQKHNKNLFYYAWTILLLLNIVGYIITGNLSNPYHFGMFKGILISLLTFYPFYYLSQTNIIEQKHLKIFFFIVLPIAIVNFYFNQELKLAQRYSENANIVNNSAYRFVSLIPFVFLLHKRKVISVCCVLLMIFFIIQGAKRGAIITGSIGITLFIYYQLKSVDKKKLIRSYLMAFFGIVIIVFFTYWFYIENDYLINRMQLLNEGNVSGRDLIYRDIFNGWYNSSRLAHLLFGYGFAASLKFSGGSFAHNDWLELLSNFGLLGVLIYLSVFISAFKFLKHSIISKEKKMMLFTILTCWLTTSLFSMGYTSTDGYMQAMLLGFIMGNNLNSKNKISSKEKEYE
ncbi:MAG: hypothetical protein WC996_06565 [Peptostreptococcales bacterium]